jgi:hypothetical protein
MNHDMCIASLKMARNIHDAPNLYSCVCVNALAVYTGINSFTESHCTALHEKISSPSPSPAHAHLIFILIPSHFPPLSSLPSLPSPISHYIYHTLQINQRLIHSLPLPHHPLRRSGETLRPISPTCKRRRLPRRILRRLVRRLSLLLPVLLLGLCLQLLRIRWVLPRCRLRGGRDGRLLWRGLVIHFGGLLGLLGLRGEALGALDGCLGGWSCGAVAVVEACAFCIGDGGGWGLWGIRLLRGILLMGYLTLELGRLLVGYARRSLLWCCASVV